MSTKTKSKAVITPPQKIPSAVRSLVDMRGVIQRARVAWGNRISAVERGADISDPTSAQILRQWYERLENMEIEIDDQIAKLVEDSGSPIIPYLKSIKGIGPKSIAMLVACIDIRRAETISALWRYCGYGVTEEGKAEKRKKGQKIHYNRRLSSYCYVIAGQFLKSKSPYSELYYEAKEQYEVSKPEWSKIHRHLASIRKMMKIFLAHTWLTWRELEGLPVGDPYIIGRDGHSHIIERQRFGWYGVITSSDEDDL